MAAPTSPISEISPRTVSFPSLVRAKLPPRPTKFKALAQQFENLTEKRKMKDGEGGGMRGVVKKKNSYMGNRGDGVSKRARRKSVRIMLVERKLERELRKELVEELETQLEMDLERELNNAETAKGGRV